MFSYDNFLSHHRYLCPSSDLFYTNMLTSEGASFVLPAFPVDSGTSQLEGIDCKIRPPTISRSFMDSTKVLELLVQNNAFEGKKAATENIRDAWKTNSVSGKVFKVTMLPRKSGIHIWLSNLAEIDVTEEIVPFLKVHMAKFASENFKIRVLTNEEVEDLRKQDEKFKAHMESVESEISTAGLRVADNLSALLLKRKNPQSSATQRMVGRLVDLVSTLITVVGRRVRVEDKSISEHLQIDEEDEDIAPA